MGILEGAFWNINPRAFMKGPWSKHRNFFGESGQVLFLLGEFFHFMFDVQ